MLPGWHVRSTVAGRRPWRARLRARRGHAAGLGPARRAPAREQPAVLVEDADAPVLGLLRHAVPPRGLSLVPPELGDVRASLLVEDDVGGALRVGPLREILAVGAEDLDAIAPAVATEQA